MDTNKPINISDEKALLDIEAIHGFLKRSHWGAKRTRETLIKSIENSLCFGAYIENKQVGFARVVTDGCTFAYLCDVFVDENHRGKGISKKLMDHIMKHPELQNYRRFVLATKNAHSLYARYGFQIAAPDIYMEIVNENV